MINTQVKKPLIPAQWYKILKLKKVEVIAQLTARSISHNITTHIMTLKSKLYKAIKHGVKTLTEQFNAIVGDDWKEAFKKSGKTFKRFKKDLLRKFHPDLHKGSDEATTICQTINEWKEPTRYDNSNGYQAAGEIARDYWRATLSKEQFLYTHKIYQRSAESRSRVVKEWFYGDYISSWIMHFEGDVMTGETFKEHYQGEAFTYKEPYPEEYADGTIHEPMTTESEATKVILHL